MNAKEFAHELEKAASFIRQQQAEIEALKQIIDANNLNQNIGQFVKPTNEPVAIVNTNCENNIQWNVLKPQSYNGYFLYTHPVKEQELLAEIEALKELNTMLKDAIEKRIRMDAERYKWLRAEFAAGRETYLAEGIPSGESLDKYIDGKLK